MTATRRLPNNVTGTVAGRARLLKGAEGLHAAAAAVGAGIGRGRGVEQPAQVIEQQRVVGAALMLNEAPAIAAEAGDGVRAVRWMALEQNQTPGRSSRESQPARVGERGESVQILRGRGPGRSGAVCRDWNLHLATKTVGPGWGASKHSHLSNTIER